jgi:hypothetical protein
MKQIMVLSVLQMIRLWNQELPQPLLYDPEVHQRHRQSHCLEFSLKL